MRHVHLVLVAILSAAPAAGADDPCMVATPPARSKPLAKRPAPAAKVPLKKASAAPSTAATQLVAATPAAAAPDALAGAAAVDPSGAATTEGPAAGPTTNNETERPLETHPRELSGDDLNFAGFQKALAARLYPRPPLDLFAPAEPPVVVADGFGLLVQRRVGH